MKKIALGLIGAGLLTAGGVIYAMQRGHGSYAEMHAAHHGGGHGQPAQIMFTTRRYAGLQGRDTTEQSR